MKKMPRLILAIGMVLLATFASSPAMAQHYSYGHGAGGSVRLGINVGIPRYWPGYYPPPYYPYPAYPYPAPIYGYPQSAPLSQSAYVEQGQTQLVIAPTQPQGDWYYCADSRSYYPNVRECTGGWQRVPAQPPENSGARIPASPATR